MEGRSLRLARCWQIRRPTRIQARADGNLSRLGEFLPSSSYEQPGYVQLKSNADFSFVSPPNAVLTNQPRSTGLALTEEEPRPCRGMPRGVLRNCAGAGVGTGGEVKLDLDSQVRY